MVPDKKYYSEARDIQNGFRDNNLSMLDTIREL